MARTINLSHAAVDLPRIVSRLKPRTAGLEREDWIEVRKGYQTAKYARTLLDSVRQRGELDDDQVGRLERDIDSLEVAFKLAVDAHPVPSSSRLPDPSEPPSLPPIPPLEDRLSTDATVIASPKTSPSILASRPPAVSIPSMSGALASPPPPTSRATTASLPTLTHAESFIAEREDEGLLPLRNARSARAAGGFGADLSARGAREVHDELSNQLADMSHQLKLNALHFSSTLDEEKKLLESSSNALESNLTKTKTSKTKLSAVSSKTRGTTWLVLISIMVVIVGWVWTYLLIRMT